MATYLPQEQETFKLQRKFGLGLKSIREILTNEILAGNITPIDAKQILSTYTNPTVSRHDAIAYSRKNGRMEREHVTDFFDGRFLRQTNLVRAILSRAVRLGGTADTIPTTVQASYVEAGVVQNDDGYEQPRMSLHRAQEFEM